MLRCLSKAPQALSVRDVLGNPWKILFLLPFCQMTIIPSSVKTMSLINCLQESMCHQDWPLILQGYPVHVRMRRR